MGTTISGVYEGGKRMRRVRALKRLENSLKFEETLAERLFNKLHVVKMSDPEHVQTTERFNNATNNVKRIVKEITILKSRI